MNTSVSLTARLSLLFAVLSVCVLLTASLLIEQAVDHQFLEHDSEELHGKMELIRGELGKITRWEEAAALPPALRSTVSGHPGIAIVIVAVDGATLFSTGPEETVKHLLQEIRAGNRLPGIWQTPARAYRIVSDHFSLGIPHAQQAEAVIALDISDDMKFFSKLHQFLWLGMSLSALVMAALGWLVARKGLSPLDEVSAMLAGISAQRLDRPMPTAGVPRELRRLMCAFNNMLARLDDSFRRLSEFSSDIAHELRTPINNLMVQTQVTLSRERSAADYCNTLHSNLEEFERLSRMIREMLFLAKADNKLVVLQREEVHLDTEVDHLFAYYEALAAERHVRLAKRGAATIGADRLMIRQVLSNLLSNAIRYTPDGMAISISIEEAPNAATLSICNPGPAIAPEHLPKIFERMYRVDHARREGGTDNVGLGLAIAKSIVEMHGGKIGATSREGQTCFVMTLPRQSV